MASGSTAGESQLQKIIRDLHDSIAELVKEYKEFGEPISDDSSNLHKLSYKLEYILQFGQKEKTTLLGSKKDYWDYFVDCLAKIKGANDGIRFVKSITEIKTSLGKGRAFIRYCLVHQRLADTLQQCLMNQRLTSDWYYSRSPLLKARSSGDIINHLYELNDVQFDIASRGHDLDATWPTFARRALNANSPSHTWKPPSRSSSINSLASNYLQQQGDFSSSIDFGHGLLNELDESLPCGEDASTIDELRLELDQSDLKMRELSNKVQQMAEQEVELRGVVEDLQRQLDISLTAQEHQQVELKNVQGREEALSKEMEILRKVEKVQDAEQQQLQEKLATAESKNIELLAKLDCVLNEKGHQAASFFDSAQKIHELLDKLKEAEKGKMDAVAEVEEKRRLNERLEEELKLKIVTVNDGATKLEEVATSKAKLHGKLEEQKNAMDMLQGALTLKEKETSNLQMQLLDLQKTNEKQENEMKMMREKFETENVELREQLENKSEELIVSSKTLQDLQTNNQILTSDKEKLAFNLANMEIHRREYAAKIEEYKVQCSNLMEHNEKLLRTVTKMEEQTNEMTEHRAELESELAVLRASEKQLRSQLDDTKVTVDEKEKRLREENRELDESLQRANLAAKTSESSAKRLEEANRALKEEQEAVKAALSRMQADLKRVHGQISNLETDLEASRKNEQALRNRLQTNDSQLDNGKKEIGELVQKVKTLEAKNKELQKAKTAAEKTITKQKEMIEQVTSEKRVVEKAQVEKSVAQTKENQEVTSKLNVLEGQLDVRMKEVSRFQAEVLDLRVQVQRSEEEKSKSQAQLAVTEAQRDELRTLTETLKVTIEEQNQKHVTELMEWQKKEEALIKEREKELGASAELTSTLAAVREEVSALKEENEQLVLENSETREGLHRANTEMAEMGMTICKLSAEKEEAREQWTADELRIEEFEKEVERFGECMDELREENLNLKEELAQMENLPQQMKELQEQLEKANGQVQSLKNSSREEVEAVKFQMSSESMNYEVQIKNLIEQLNKVKMQLQEEQKCTSSLQKQVSELEALNEQYLLLTGEKDAHITKSEATIRNNDTEIQQLRHDACSVKDAYLAAQGLCEELKHKLETAEVDNQTQIQMMSAEIDDLNRTKTTLEERLIELIRDKDALWQKSDALEFEQKLRSEERWWLMDKEATHCLGCQGQFTWWLRKHHCRLCGRIFCYYCSNNFVMIKQSGKKERCCKECFNQNDDVVERFTDAESQASPSGPGPQPCPEPAPDGPTPEVTDPINKSDDGAFDIITEDEVHRVYDSDAGSQTTAGSLDGEQTTRLLNISAGDVTPEEGEDPIPTVQDSEINLLKTGEVTMAIPFTIEDLSQFGGGSRELFIKSSNYSVITVTVCDCGPTISWMFSSEPKSICFSVVHRGSSEVPIEQSKVLIPLTRCNSHKEKVQGQLKVRLSGLYTFIFDNSFSRFISKKVFYHLTMEQPIIYDGSDFP